MNKTDEVIHDLLGFKNRSIIQHKDRFHFSLDTVLLADFVHLTKHHKAIIDFGTGHAPIPLFLSTRTEAMIVGYEMQKELVELAQRNVKLNQCERQITIVEGDLKTIHHHYPASQFDIITCNPPYFKLSEAPTLSSQDSLKLARHELELDLEVLMKAARTVLKQKGSFYMIHRASRLQDISVALADHGFSLKRLRMVHSKAHTPALRVLVEARFKKSSDTDIVPPLIVHEEDGTYSAEAQAIFRNREEIR
jgi:tRNA1(Val) A37 N6-methylase TrmN6